MSGDHGTLAYSVAEAIVAVKERKQRLEKDIMELIHAFSKETEVMVTDIHCRSPRMMVLEGHEWSVPEIIIEVRL